MWAPIQLDYEKHMKNKTTHKICISSSERASQMAELHEFSDASLYEYPQEEYMENVEDHWQYCLTMVQHTLGFLHEPHTLQWWSRVFIIPSI